MANYACGFNQPEMGKYFEWIIKNRLHALQTLSGYWVMVITTNDYNCSTQGSK